MDGRGANRPWTSHKVTEHIRLRLLCALLLYRPYSLFFYISSSASLFLFFQLLLITVWVSPPRHHHHWSPSPFNWMANVCEAPSEPTAVNQIGKPNEKEAKRGTMDVRYSRMVVVVVTGDIIWNRVAISDFSILPNPVVVNVIGSNHQNMLPYPSSIHPICSAQLLCNKARFSCCSLVASLFLYYSQYNTLQDDSIKTWRILNPVFSQSKSLDQSFSAGQIWKRERSMCDACNLVVVVSLFFFFFFLPFFFIL